MWECLNFCRSRRWSPCRIGLLMWKCLIKFRNCVGWFHCGDLSWWYFREKKGLCCNLGLKLFVFQDFWLFRLKWFRLSWSMKWEGFGLSCIESVMKVFWDFFWRFCWGLRDFRENKKKYFLGMISFQLEWGNFDSGFRREMVAVWRCFRGSFQGKWLKRGDWCSRLFCGGEGSGSCGRWSWFVVLKGFVPWVATNDSVEWFKGSFENSVFF